MQCNRTPRKKEQITGQNSLKSLSQKTMKLMAWSTDKMTTSLKIWTDVTTSSKKVTKIFQESKHAALHQHRKSYRPHSTTKELSWKSLTPRSRKVASSLQITCCTRSKLSQSAGARTGETLTFTRYDAFWKTNSPTFSFHPAQTSRQRWREKLLTSVKNSSNVFCKRFHAARSSSHPFSWPHSWRFRTWKNGRSL